MPVNLLYMHSPIDAYRRVGTVSCDGKRNRIILGTQNQCIEREPTTDIQTASGGYIYISERIPPTAAMRQGGSVTHHNIALPALLLRPSLRHKKVGRRGRCTGRNNNRHTQYFARHNLPALSRLDADIRTRQTVHLRQNNMVHSFRRPLSFRLPSTRNAIVLRGNNGIHRITICPDPNRHTRFVPICHKNLLTCHLARSLIVRIIVLQTIQAQRTPCQLVISLELIFCLRIGNA